MVKEAACFYFSGYFLTTQDGVDTMQTVAEYALNRDQVNLLT